MNETKKDIRTEVYNALADIMFESDASKESMDEAIEWFQTHFYESDDWDEDEE